MRSGIPVSFVFSICLIGWRWKPTDRPSTSVRRTPALDAVTAAHLRPARHPCTLMSVNISSLHGCMPLPKHRCSSKTNSRRRSVAFRPAYAEDVGKRRPTSSFAAVVPFTLASKRAGRDECSGQVSSLGQWQRKSVSTATFGSC